MDASHMPGVKRESSQKKRDGSKTPPIIPTVSVLPQTPTNDLKPFLSTSAADFSLFDPNICNTNQSCLLNCREGDEELDSGILKIF